MENFKKVRVASVGDISGERPVCADADGKELAIFRRGGRYLALASSCTHKGGPLCEGRVRDGVVICPWHNSGFKIDTGEAVEGPATVGVATYAVEVHGDNLYVLLPDDKPGEK